MKDHRFFIPHKNTFGTYLWNNTSIHSYIFVFKPVQTSINGDAGYTVNRSESAVVDKVLHAKQGSWLQFFVHSLHEEERKRNKQQQNRKVLVSIDITLKNGNEINKNILTNKNKKSQYLQ